MRAFQKSPTFLPSYFKAKQFDRDLTVQEVMYSKATAFKIVVSGQEVYLYERTHIPASNPVERIGV